MTLWVVGGEMVSATKNAEEWQIFKKAVVLRMEEDGSCERVLEYQTPPENRPDPAPVVFKAAHIVEDQALLCTQREILVCRMPTLEVKKVISLHCFNDVHHVTMGPNGNYFVAVTGLDAMAEVTPDGELVRLTDVLGGDVWDRFNKDTDYRKILSTKPHQSHPNFVFFVDGRPWVTRFHQRDAVPIDDVNSADRIALGDTPVHDGLVSGRTVYFTCVNGQVVKHDLDSRTTESHDLTKLNQVPDRPLGWCRGVLPSKQGVWVGFSRIRPTKFRENLSWIRRGFRQTSQLPSRISLYSHDFSQLKREVVLEEFGMGVVFSVHETPS